ncbi:hypothetical protein PG993_006500 [Apiospora rasikravindrae]|uniref:RING-type domain-containing protein n=1 Tax=Apiospora rasikravindrae TaxID=990691 RepID=A0ABR1T6D1_9PEZI
MANFLNLVNGFPAPNNLSVGEDIISPTGDDEGIFISAMGSYLGPDGYFAIPFTNEDVDFTFPTRLVDTDNNNYYSSRNSSSSNNNNNLPSFPDTFGPTTATTTNSNIGHPDFALQVPYSSDCPVWDPLYQYRDFAETQTAQFQQPPLPLSLPNPNFGGGNTHPFCGGFGQSGASPGFSSSEVINSDRSLNRDLNPNLNPLTNQGFHHPLSSASAFLAGQESDEPSPVVPGQGQSQGQVQEQCACAPHRPQDSVDPPSHSHSPPSHYSFDNTIDIGSSSSNSDVWHLHNFNHNLNHQPPAISNTVLLPAPQPPQQQQPSLINHQNTNFDSINSANIPSAITSASGQEPASDDHYISALASANFSSPSLPPLNSSPFAAARTQTTQLTESSSFPQPNFGNEMPSATTSSTAPPRRSRRLSQVVDLTKESPNRAADTLLSSSPVPMGPPAATTTRKRRRSSAANASASGRRTSTASIPSRLSRRRVPARLASPDGSEEDLEVLDLSKADEVPKELQKPAIDKRIKLSKFQCVICMDDVSNLTVTHCGHLFCSECLHSALHIDSNKKCCPVCRSKVEIRTTGKNLKSYYHLELKVMTATRKGKQPVGR